MPAPVPITIRYDQAGQLGGLASAAGQSQYQYNDWQQRRARDAAFTEGVLNRRQQMNLARLHSDTELQKAAMALQHAGGYRQRAQAAGTVTSTTGRAQTPLQIAKDEEALKGARLRNEALSSKNAPEKRVPLPGMDGTSVNEYPGRQGVFPSTRQETVPQSVADQIKYLQAIKGTMDPSEWNAAYVAAKSGQLKMDQLIDDTRQMNQPGHMNASGRAQDKFTAENEELSAVANLPPTDQAQYARRRFGMQDPDIYSDADAIKALQSRQRQVEAFRKPVVNSSGRTPTGGNPIKVNTPQEAMSLPSGTYFVTPDGRMKRVP